MSLMSERIYGSAPSPRRGNPHGSSRRGLVAHAPNLESQRTQSYLDKQKQIENFRRPHEEQVLEPRALDLGNKELPAYAKKQEFQKSVQENKITIVTGPTGSGKSTQGVQYLIESGYDHTYALVPRQIIADNLGDRLRVELREHYGEAADSMVDIIHGDRAERSANSVATVMTPETFLRMEKDIREMKADKNIVIFNDEIHEQDLYTEIALASSIAAVDEYEGWHAVLASATMDESFIQAAYQEVNEKRDVPVVKIEGRPHPIATSERPDINAMEAYLEIGEDHEKLMIFTRGDKQINHIIKETTKMLEAREKGSSKNVVFRKLISTLTTNARRHVFTDPVPEGSRLAIVSTPAGMSGITFAGCTGVIVDGVVNRKELNDYGIEGLISRYASKAEITQMFGRAARDVGGGVGMLVKPTTIIDDSLRARGIEVDTPELEYKTFDERVEYPPAQIYNDNLSGVTLRVAHLQKRLTNLNPYLRNKVELSDILKAEQNLSHLGALQNSYEISELGEAMDRYPLTPELSRGLVEATQPGRTLIHMARAALTLAAIDVGGLQDFTKKDGRAWEKLIRSSSHDDFIAQLDIMTAIQDQENFEKVAHDYDLQPHKVEQVAKTVRKIFKILNIRADNLVFTTPKSEEEDLLRDDFTPGMIDLVYEKSGRRRRIQQYQHILGNEGSTQREISDRSVASEEVHDYIAGFPRWYISHTRQGDQLHEIIDRTLIVKPEVVARYAAKIPGMLRAESLQPRIDGGRVVEQEQLRFGSIIVGEQVPSMHDVIPEESRKLLEERVLQKPGIAQQALREIADELDWFEKTIPKNELDKLKNSDAPKLITDESIRQLIHEKTALTRDMHVIDELLVAHIYSKNISIQKYYDQDILNELRTRSPKIVTIGKSFVDVYYDNGQPYITRVGAIQRQAPLSDFYLPDGREILVQISRSQKLGGTVRISPKDLISE
jgi:HrpA-like RNA helicase